MIKEEYIRELIQENREDLNDVSPSQIFAIAEWFNKRMEKNIARHPSKNATIHARKH